jgi:8-oxo-dGTP diphosphatase
MEGTIRLRACLAVVEVGRILLIPHYADGGEAHWLVPGGQVHRGEGLEQAAMREFTEETGLEAHCDGLLDVSEAPLPGRCGQVVPPAFCGTVTITYRGTVTGGCLRAEVHPRYGSKLARWFTWDELQHVTYHPPATVCKALGVGEPGRD